MRQVARRNAIFFSMAILAMTIGTRHLDAQRSSSEAEDKYQWLENVSGERSMAWVKSENERSAKVLESDPHYAGLQAAALKVLESPERLPTPDLRDKFVYNTWQDAQHVRGILRRTTLPDYLTPEPHWQTVLDYDALAKKDNEKWVQKGINCLYPGTSLCLVRLSAGGEDAVTMREFNLKTGKFLPNGFVLPKSKQDVAWADKNTLLVARDWGAGSMTTSGYPFIIKLWKRGESLDVAKEVFRGTADDVRVEPITLEDSYRHRVTMVVRAINFFETEVSLLTSNGTTRVALPAKSEIDGLVKNQLIVTLNEDWKPEGLATTFVQGSVVSISLPALKKDSAHLKPTVVFAPTAVEFAQEAAVTKNHLLLTTLEHVQGRAYIYTRQPNGIWTRAKLDVPDNQTISITSTNNSDDQFFLSRTGFLSPSALLLGDAATGSSLSAAKELPAQFDASNEVVEQFEATSKDGTKVPYFLVRRKDLSYDSATPTILTAYGGFQISSTPHYSALVGKLWLEKGGAYVLANIRGGGEFGPAWHEAGLKTNRQRIYDDFAAVGQDLVTRKITSPRRLGIVGGSNGGLLMGVEMTQHPEMWRAIYIGVPLLDMLRFEQIAAGASWVGEYGSVSIPEQRAFLASISPYNQLKPDADYPEPLIFTTTKDDRVGPVHARKFAAKMEEMNKPFLYQEIIEGGHGAGADLKEQARTWAIEYTYFARKLMD